MTVLLAGLVLILFSLVSFFLRRLSAVKLPQVWITGILGVSWLLVGLGYLELNQTMLRLPWGGFFSELPDLVITLDSRGWAFAQTAVTIALVQTIQSRRPTAELESNLRLTGVGVLAGTAESLFSLLAVWVLLDLIWYSAGFFRPGWSIERVSSFLPALTVVTGPLILLLLSLYTPGDQLIWDEFPSRFAPYLAAAGALRLGVLNPPRAWFDDRLPLLGQNWTSRMIPNLVAFLLVVRAAEVGWESPSAGLVSSLEVGLLFIGMLAYFSSRGRSAFQFWTIGFFGLAVVSAAQYHGAHSQAWSTTLLLGGTLIHLQLSERKPHPILLACILAAFSGLPFTPLWGRVLAGGGLTSGWLTALAAGLLIGSILSVVISDFRKPDPTVERNQSAAWISAALLIFNLYWINISSAWWRSSLSFWDQPLLGWLVPLIFGASFLAVWFRQDLPEILPNLSGAAADFSRLTARGLEGGLRISAVLFQEILGLLEGRGGLVWALLGAFLMLSLLLGGG